MGYLFLRNLKKFGFFLKEVLGFESFYYVCFVNGIFYYGKTRKIGSFFKRDFKGERYCLCQIIAVHGCSSLFFSQTDSAHLYDAAFVFGQKVCVGFYPVDYYYAIGCIGVFVKVYGRSVLCLAKQNGFHIRPYLASHGLFVDAVLMKYFYLALCRCSAVTSHGRNDEGFCLAVKNIINCGLYYFIYVVYAP